MTSRTPARLHLGAAAVLSVAEAAELLPWSDAKAREWLELHGLVIRHASVPGPCVLWASVVDVLQRQPVEPVGQRLKRSGVL